MGKWQDQGRYARARLDSGHHRRIMITMVVLGFLAFVPVLTRLVGLMIVDHDYYSALALRNQTRVTQISAHRGTIFDRNMEMLAISVDVENVYLAPRELRQSGAELDALADVLGDILQKDPKWIREEASNNKYRYRQIGSNVDADTADKIRRYINENGIKGVHLEPSSKRVYPEGTLAAQVIGFANAAGEGVEGVEASYNGFLTGKSGAVVSSKGNNELDMPFGYEGVVSSRKGADVVLTLDKVVQNCLEKHMKSAIARYDVQNGAFGIVMDCKTGEILAMATLGSYDPNAYLEIADPAAAQTLEELRLGYYWRRRTVQHIRMEKQPMKLH